MIRHELSGANAQITAAAKGRSSLIGSLLSVSTIAGPAVAPRPGDPVGGSIGGCAVLALYERSSSLVREVGHGLPALLANAAETSDAGRRSPCSVTLHAVADRHQRQAEQHRSEQPS
jgi:hypothetical protein